MKLKVPNLSQNDKKWKRKKLGTSTICTLGSDGCLLCCATAICNYHGKTITPDQLNDKLVKVKGFYQGALLVYSAVTKVFPDITFDWDVWEKGECSDKPAPLGLIDEILASNRVPIVKVDYNPSTSKIEEHWVCIIGRDEVGSYLIMDPIDGTTQYFQARYKDPSRYIFRIVCYSGKIPTTEVEEKSEYVKQLEKDRIKFWTENTQLKKDNEELKKQIISLNEQVASMAKTIEEIKSEDADFGKEAFEVEKKLQKTEKELERGLKSVSELEKGMETLQAENKRLSDALVAKGGIETQGKEVKNMAEIKKSVVWEAIKEPLRLFILGIVPFAIAYFTELNYSWAGGITVALRFIDRFLHEYGKVTKKEGWLGVKGLTNF